MIKYIQFQQQFDAQRLQQEVAQLEAATWQDHYNRAGYAGNWSTIQLRALHGQPHHNVAAHAGGLPPGSAYQDTPLLAHCPYLKEVIDFFQIEKTAVRLMKLDAGASIKPHRDHDLNFEEGEVRLHIPVITNPQLRFYLEQERLVMDEGSCWYLNLAREHEVINDGPAARIHLVIDGIVNEWLRAYFARGPHRQVVQGPGAGERGQAQPPGPQFSSDDQRRIIAQLREMKTAVANAVADEMQAALPA